MKRSILRSTLIRFRCCNTEAPNAECSVNVSGVVTPGQVKTILASCDKGMFFIPEKVHLPYMWETNQTDGLHLCQLAENNFEPSVQDPTVDIDIRTLTGLFKGQKNKWF